MTRLLSNEQLEQSSVVANNAMNRERGLIGGNSYEKDLKFDLTAFLQERLQRQSQVRWLDLCCGTGKALLEAAQYFHDLRLTSRLQIIGVDLVPFFRPVPLHLTGVQLLVHSVTSVEPDAPFDLITCVHGLHYIGDKLAVIANAARWLTSDGVFLAHLDLTDVQHPQGALARQIKHAFAKNNIDYRSRQRILHIHGHQEISFPFVYLGARDDAGPNYTGQPAVHSYYDRIPMAHNNG